MASLVDIVHRHQVPHLQGLKHVSTWWTYTITVKQQQ